MRQRWLVGVFMVAFGLVGFLVSGMMAFYTTTQLVNEFNRFYFSSIEAYVDEAIKPIIPTADSTKLFEKINQYREAQGLVEFRFDDAVCGAVNQVEVPSTASVFQVCTQCTNVSLVTIGKFATTNQLLNILIKEETTAATLTDNSLTYLCISEKADQLVLLFAKKSTEPIKTNVKEKVGVIQNPTYFTENELWEALTAYRTAQGRSNLSLDENICSYARKRVNDHIKMQKEVKAESYPNPDKYPLDAHQGFAMDAESGLAFEITQKQKLAENLAYWPSAEAAVHIIEWGWDSSTEGHRETQLGDWSAACITGDQGYYVAIFGK